MSTGPYRVDTYRPGRELTLSRNAAWRQETDTVRWQHVLQIQVIMGVPASEAIERVAAGDADALWDVPPPDGTTPLGGARIVRTDSGELNPCLVLNTVSPTETNALADIRVRQALAYAVDKRAIADIYGGPGHAMITDQLLPEGNPAHRPFSLYPSPEGRGDPAAARRLLAAAGREDGLTLTMAHRDAGRHPQVAEAVRDALARAGITIRLKPVAQSDFYPRLLQDAENARSGVWDLVAQGWLPDWQGRNARSYLQPHFDSAALGYQDPTWGVVYGGYRNPIVNSLIRDAVTATDAATADQLFHEVDRTVMSDAPVVPILFVKSATLCSERVRDFRVHPYYLGDPTHVWLAR